MIYKIFLFILATNWASGEDDHVVARAEYDFSAASEEEISLRAGDLINLAPKGEISLLSFLVIITVGVVLYSIFINDFSTNRCSPVQNSQLSPE